MSERVTIEAAMAAVERSPKPALIAIDGLPCSGKSTLVERLQQRLELDCIYLDDFVLPEADWPSRSSPGFPFPYIRYDAFLEVVQTLALVGQCSYCPFDWETLTVSATPRLVSLSKPVLVEGVSALNPSLCDLYSLKIFVDSDRASTLDAAVARGVGPWGAEWRELFLPSADLYMLTQPMSRADLIVAGRGVGDKETE